jgi:Papain family cysteine protease
MIRGLVDFGVLYHRYNEDIHQGMRLGRHQLLDARSLAYMVENDIESMNSTIASQLWQRVIPILDQGQLGSCTGNAGTGALGTEPFYSEAGKAVLPAAGDTQACERFAVQLYSEATEIDPSPGTHPQTDTGSSGLAVCQILKNQQTIHGYRWARTAYGFLALLQAGPVLQGMPWYNSFFHPDSAGFIDADPNWRVSGIAGGHEVEAIGVEIDRANAYNSVVLYANSWGTSWGDAGRFRMRLRTYEELSGVDLKQYTF